MRSTIFAVGFLLLVSFVHVSAQDEAQLRQLAKRLVQSASVKKGDVVVITGGKHMIPLMEDVAVEVQIAGGFANMWLFTDKVQRAIYVDEPEEFLGQKDTFSLDWYKKVNVEIDLPTLEDYTKVIEGVSDARMAKAKGPAEDRTTQLNSLMLREVAINLPAEGNAKAASVDFPTLQKMYWNAINADYNAIASRAAKLKAILRAGKQVRVTNPTGTDFTFSLGAGRPIIVDDGIVTEEDAKSPYLTERFASLPAGLIQFAPVETSANGVVSVAKDYCRSLVRDTHFDFKDGKLENYTSANDRQCFLDAMAPYSGTKDMIGYFTIGLNPEMKVMDTGDQNFLPQNAAGMVFVGLGENKLIGGTNPPTGAPGYGWAIPNATVTVDGRLIVKDGKLVF